MKVNMKKLEEERKRLGLSKFEFSKLIGMVPSNYTYLLQEETTKLATLNKMAKKLSISPKDLLI